MDFKKVAIGFLIFGITMNLYAQDYFIVNNDTTFCSDLKYSTTMQGYLSSMSYVNIDGENVDLKGRKNVPDVLTFFIDSVITDKVPLKAKNPNGYIRYTKRVVDGKLKVYLSHQGYNSTMVYTPGSAFGDFSTVGPSGIYRFYIKMPDGTYYKINKQSNLRKYIKPYLLKCTEFKNQYKGDFSPREQPFMDMIELYNSLCN